jgi:hypothetical protein
VPANGPNPSAKRSATSVGLFLLIPTVFTLGGGWWLVRYANGIPVPEQTRPRAVPATVTELVAVPCFYRSGRPRRTCFRTVVDYEDPAGSAKRLPSRKAYHPAAHAIGSKVLVLVKPDGTVILDREWEADTASAVRDYKRARNFPLVMGWMVLVVGGFMALLVVGLVRAGRRDEPVV